MSLPACCTLLLCSYKSCMQLNQTLSSIVATPLLCSYTSVWLFSFFVYVPRHTPTKHSEWCRSSHMPLAEVGDGLTTTFRAQDLAPHLPDVSTSLYCQHQPQGAEPWAEDAVARPSSVSARGAQQSHVTQPCCCPRVCIKQSCRQIHVPLLSSCVSSSGESSASSSQMHNR